MSFDVDLFVIGGGSGGVRAARTSAQTGAKVALAEDNRMGGTCVIRGCVPKKLMVFASEFREQTAMARDYGWSAETGSFDWPQFRTKLHAELDRLEGVYHNILSSNNVTIHEQRATVSGPHEVTLADGTKITAGHILLATGGHPVRPDTKNAELGMVSDDIFDMETLPRSILIIGGGYIACEFACILNGLGVEVTQFYRGAQVLRGFDEEARGLIADMMREQGVDLHCGTTIVEMDKATGGIRVKGSNGSDHSYDRVLFATGRAPNSAGMGLEDLGIKLNRKGAVEVNEFSQTAVPSIYAIGDLTDRINLTPVAIREGVAFTETVFKNNPTAPDHDLVASAVFTQPELGTVGLSEEAARDQEEIEVYATSFKPMKSAFAGRSQRVMMKLIVSKATRKILGCHIVSDGAGELIQMVGIAVKAGLTKEDFDRTVAVHPTMSEELVTMHTPVRTA